MPIFRRLLVRISIFCILAIPISALAQHSQSAERPTGAHPAAPEFLIHAQKKLENAKAALEGEQKALDQLRQQEEALRHAAILRTRSWIEPIHLWKSKEQLKQGILRRQKTVDVAARNLARAEARAWATSESTWSKHHPASWFGSWWQWYEVWIRGK
jgi:hypothetical protein